MPPPVVFQGDSRRLLEVVGGGMGAAVGSPPFQDSDNRGAAAMPDDYFVRADGRPFGEGPAIRALLGDTPGQLGAMPSGDYAAAVGSPPFEGVVNHDGGRADYLEAKNLHSDYGQSPGQLGSMPSGDYAAAVGSPPFVDQLPSHDDFQPPHDSTARLGVNYETAYGNAPGQLGTMKTGDFTAAVSSPPYSDMIDNSGEGPGARHDPVYHNGDNAYKASSANGYGTTPGNLGSMAGVGFEAAVADAVVSSPPYGESLSSPKDSENIDTKIAAAKIAGQTTQRARWGSNQGSAGWSADAYGSTEGQLGSESPDTFWAAARVIVEQTYQALRPGGYAAWVTKRFIRKGQIVEFSDQWQALCEAVGFEPVERIAALLYENHGTQLGLFGEDKVLKKERMSFFRRLAHKKGSPYIGHEDVLIMRKPNA